MTLTSINIKRSSVTIREIPQRQKYKFRSISQINLEKSTEENKK